MSFLFNIIKKSFLFSNQTQYTLISGHKEVAKLTPQEVHDSLEDVFLDKRLLFLKTINFIHIILRIISDYFKFAPFIIFWFFVIFSLMDAEGTYQVLKLVTSSSQALLEGINQFFLLYSYFYLIFMSVSLVVSNEKFGYRSIYRKALFESFKNKLKNSEGLEGSLDCQVDCTYLKCESLGYCRIIDFKDGLARTQTIFQTYKV